MQKRITDFFILLAALTLLGGCFAREKVVKEESADPYSITKIRILDAVNPESREYPGGRGVNELVAYSPEFGQRTGTNQWGVEATVVEGIVEKVEGNNSRIPENGFVLSGHDDGRDWINENIKPGMSVQLNAKKERIHFTEGTRGEIRGMRIQLGRIEKRAEALWSLLSDQERDEIDSTMAGAKAQLEMAETHHQQGRYEMARRAAFTATQSVDRAWILTSRSPRLEVRAFWDRISAQNPEDIRRLLDEMEKNGINMLLPETLYDGASLFPSENVPQHEHFSGWDPLEVLIKEGHRRGIEIHVWVENMFVGIKDSPLIRMHPEWLMQTRDGRTESTLEPGYRYFSWCRPEARQLILDYYKELARKYPDLDGLQLDYIRFPLSEPGTEDWDYSEPCRRAYQAATGVDPMDITPEQEGAWAKWSQWRENQVSEFVAEVRRELKAINPDLDISAAVFAPLEESRESKYQNWGEWLAEGQLDFVCPMLYTFDSEEVEKRTREMIEMAGGRAEVIPGLGAYLKIPPKDLLEQVRQARQAGAPGVAVFSWSSSTPEQRRFLGQGPFRRRARIPW
jgi:uncharacterized lipoprotein YddW (UPF0748 family)